MANSRRSSTRPRPGTSAPLALVAGAALAYLFDPDQGSARRARVARAVTTRRQGSGAQGADSLRDKARVTRDKAAGRAQQAVRTPSGPESDRALVDKVRSEVLGTEPYREATVNVMAADGTVTLRGQLQRPDLIRSLREDVAKVAGVRRVESYLHLPGTEAPNKADVAEASQDAVRRVAEDNLQHAPD